MSRNVPDISESISMLWASIASQGGVFQLALLLTFINLVVLNLYVAKHSEYVEKTGVTSFFVAYDLIFPKGKKGAVCLALLFSFICLLASTIYIGVVNQN
ncbi:MAG: hypothetical protein ACPH3N_06810 [Alcanivorax sediminis]|uniref:hypothetical protein n=1 Tax=Alcanivorax sediminis TaxID=2663008 RepID=UPI003C4F6EED